MRPQASYRNYSAAVTTSFEAHDLHRRLASWAVDEGIDEKLTVSYAKGALVVRIHPAIMDRFEAAWPRFQAE